MEKATIRATTGDHQIAKLTALAIGLHLLESAFPSPIPGVKPGIANIITLYVVFRFDFKTAVWVSLLRVFASSLLLGQFLSPSFFLSFAGACLSLITLSFCQKLPKQYFSAVSVSILMAITHVLGQLIIVRLWFIPHANIVYLLPVFMLSALIFGCINGIVTQQMLKTNASQT